MIITVDNSLIGEFINFMHENKYAPPDGGKKYCVPFDYKRNSENQTTFRLKPADLVFLHQLKQKWEKHLTKLKPKDEKSSNY